MAAQVNKFLLEFLGTAIFLYVILATSGNGLAIGAALALLIVLGVSLGGTGHYNPAVSVMMVAANKLPTQDLLPYIIVQVFGGLCALELFKRTGPLK